MLGWNGRVFRNHLRHHTAQGLNTQGEWRHIQQQNVFAIARQNRALNRCTNGNGFVWVHVFAWLFAKDVLHFVLYFGHARLTAHQNHIIDVGCRYARILECHLAWAHGALNQFLHQGLELRTGEFQVQVLRTTGVCRDVGQVDFGLLR